MNLVAVIDLIGVSVRIIRINRPEFDPEIAVFLRQVLKGKLSLEVSVPCDCRGDKSVGGFTTPLISSTPVGPGSVSGRTPAVQAHRRHPRRDNSRLDLLQV